MEVALYAGFALNFVGTLQSKSLQKLLQVVLFAALVYIGVAGLVSGAAPKALAADAGAGSFGVAMIFVMLFMISIGLDELANPRVRRAR